MNLVLQAVGIASVITGLYLMAHKRRAAWLVYQVGGVAWIWLFLRSELYGAVLAQVVYMSMNVYGWIKWGKERR